MLKSHRLGERARISCSILSNKSLTTHRGGHVANCCRILPTADHVSFSVVEAEVIVARYNVVLVGGLWGIDEFWHVMPDAFFASAAE